MKQAPLRVETEESLQKAQLLLEVLRGLARAKDIPAPAVNPSVAETTVDELVAHVTTVLKQHRSQPLRWSL